MSLLVPALIAAGALAIKKKGTGNKTIPSKGRYAVLSEVKEGKGAGAVAVSYITTNKQDAIKFAENAAEAVAVAGEADYVENIDLSHPSKQKYIAGYKVSIGENEIVFLVLNY